MNQEAETVAEEINNIYSDLFDKLFIEIRDIIIEGFFEGIKEGVKEGLSEMIGLGFLGIKKEEARSFEEIMKETISKHLEDNASKMTKQYVCPSIKTWLGEQCNETIRIVSAKGQIKTADDAIHLAGYLKLEEKADKRYKELSDKSKGVIPSSFIVQSLYKGFQSTIWGCVKDDIKSCQKRISEIK